MTAPDLSLRLLADENIEYQVVDLLRRLGHNVMWLVTDAPGTDDEDIPAIADSEGRILITYDVDFISAMRLSGRTHAGAVLVRAGHSDFSWIATALHETLRGRKSWAGRIAVIKPNGVRYIPQD
jgi:predicted nuclease of predicted toxin-antitoxin system